MSQSGVDQRSGLCSTQSSRDLRLLPSGVRGSTLLLGLAILCRNICIQPADERREGKDDFMGGFMGQA